LLSLAVALCNPFSAKAQGEKRITKKSFKLRQTALAADM